MDEKVTAILIRATDLRDYDKSVCLFSAEKGLINAVMRGVRRPTAKLKFACQPFAFCEYELAVKGEKYTVTGASVVGDLFPLTQSPEKFFAGALTTEAVECASVASDAPTLFLVALKTLKAIMVTNGNLHLILAKFLQKVLSINGFLPKIDKQKRGDSADGILSTIATLTMDEVTQLDIPYSPAKSALRQIIAQFENAHETKLKSKKPFFEIMN